MILPVMSVHICSQHDYDDVTCCHQKKFSLDHKDSFITLERAKRWVENFHVEQTHED
jgi:transcriptional antiterminator Rof (Rho-off)